MYENFLRSLCMFTSAGWRAQLLVSIGAGVVGVGWAWMFEMKCTFGHVESRSPSLLSSPLRPCLPGWSLCRSTCPPDFSFHLSPLPGGGGGGGDAVHIWRWGNLGKHALKEMAIASIFVPRSSFRLFPPSLLHCMHATHEREIEN